MIKLQAHRGVSSEYPENTFSAFRAAVAQGNDVIEFDPKFTKDGEIVVLHDFSLNRTGRLPGGGQLSKEIKINEISLAEDRSFDYGLWFDNSFKGEKLPLFSELLSFAEQYKITLKIDNVWERFPEDVREKLFGEYEKNRIK